MIGRLEAEVYVRQGLDPISFRRLVHDKHERKMLRKAGDEVYGVDRLAKTVDDASLSRAPVHQGRARCILIAVASGATGGRGGLALANTGASTSLTAGSSLSLERQRRRRSAMCLDPSGEIRMREKNATSDADLDGPPAAMDEVPQRLYRRQTEESGSLLIRI